MLRKTCESILANIGLANYHVQIDTQNKCLELVSAYGKPIVSIRGITFTRLPPTKNEIAYAGELLNTFLVKHMVLINQMLTLQEKVYKHVNLQKTHPDFFIGSYYATHDEKIEAVEYTDNVFQVRVRLNKAPTIIVNNSKRDTPVTMSELEGFTFDKGLFILAKSIAVDAHRQETQENELRLLQKKLLTCDI